MMAPASPAAPAPAGRNRFAFATWLFIRLLALIHFIAFLSFWVQLDGLVGPHGLLPATDYFTAAREQLGATAYLELPSLCWIFGTGRFLPILCAGGVVCSVLVFVGVAPAFGLFFIWAGYLSLNCAGQIFFNFQWDALLLETTLLAIFVVPWSWLPRWRFHEPPRLARLLVWWLLFRLMFLAGVVKLSSGDPLWRSLTALSVHYETQPLPTPLAWYAHQGPLWWQRATCAGMFVIELFVPFFVFASRGLRHNAALLLAAFMAAIALTGNYTFFNALAVALCLACLDDAWWTETLAWVAPKKFRHLIDDKLAAVPAPAERPRLTIRRQIGIVTAGFVFAFTGVQALAVVVPFGAPPGYPLVAGLLAPFRSFNNYGLFAVMTNPRTELIFEGSDDGRDWRAYEFPHKPGDLRRRPTWVAPHQPRLDWQLWFAALGSPEQNRWVLALCEHLLRGTPEVLALLERNPFPQKPPRFVRIVRYEYHFTDAATRARTGQWWRRTPLDFYVAPASLR
jgi:lipase maturation factor 1